ncbi:YcxB family protein [Tissierella sp. Yu-01]|uniref:YcxB family protein n=1 Tax=Tissierella sp. Yu-01 TaxID=3035694 RepID=UPI00240DA7DB|nr:YcxB family protein [Tissierella sp. Yu-01]WFA10188.1 YcxB family protein [Tissierella sp. Yu-01]
MEFNFALTKYNDVSFKPQVSKALEKRTELVSRKKYPKVWKYTDKMSSKRKASEEVLKKRRGRYIYGIILLLLGFFLLIPSLIEPKEMLIPLLVGAFTVGIGILNIKYGIKSKKVKITAFDKAAIKLFSEYEKIPTVKASVTFTNDKVQLVGNVTIDYSEIEKILITEDLFILIWNERITVLQKKDLSSSNVEEFINFITNKSYNLFEVVNII